MAELDAEAAREAEAERLRKSALNKKRWGMLKDKDWGPEPVPTIELVRPGLHAHLPAGRDWLS